MGPKIAFGSPWPLEKRLYIQALGQLIQTGSGDIPERPPDPLTPFREAWPDERKKLISMRLNGWVLELTKEMARQHDMPYQTILRIWIEEGLRHAMLEGSQNNHSTEATPADPAG